MSKKKLIKKHSFIPEDKRTLTYVNNAYDAILSKSYVKDVIALNLNGVIIKATMDRDIGYVEGGIYLSLYEKALYILQQLDPQDDILSVRVRTKCHETIITPDKKVVFIVTQNPMDKINEFEEELDEDI